MSNVSIVINGAKYNSVKVDECEGYDSICEECDLCEDCTGDNLFQFCSYYLDENQVFKKD